MDRDLKYLCTTLSPRSFSSAEVHLLPVSESTKHKLSYITAAPLIKRVGQFLQVLEIGYSVPGDLLPGGLSTEHEIGVVEEEEAYNDGCYEHNRETEEDKDVGA